MMNSNNTPKTFANGITILRTSSRGAHLITDGINTTWIQSGWIREDGSLTPGGMQSLLNSESTLEQYNQDQINRQRAREERQKTWEIKKEEGKQLVTMTIAKGILKSDGPTTYKYAAGKGFDMYRHLCTRWNYIPKSMVSVERKNNQVYVTLPKWLAEKHSIIFKVVD